MQSRIQNNQTLQKIIRPFQVLHHYFTVVRKQDVWQQSYWVRDLGFPNLGKMLFYFHVTRKLPYNKQMRFFIENNFHRLFKLFTLLKLAPPPKYLTDDNRRPLIVDAMEREHNLPEDSRFVITRFMLKHGANPNSGYSDFTDIYLPLSIQALNMGEGDLFYTLMAKGAMINDVDGENSTLFMFACGKALKYLYKLKNGSEDTKRKLLNEVAAFLLHKGANPYYKDKWDYFALTHAMQKKQMECAQWLIDNIPVIGMDFGSTVSRDFSKPGVDRFFGPPSVMNQDLPFTLNTSNGIFIECTVDGLPITRDTPGFENAKIISKDELMVALKQNDDNCPINKNDIAKACRLYLRARSSKISLDEIETMKEIMHLAKNQTLTLKSLGLKFFNENEDLMKDALMGCKLPLELKEDLRSFSRI